MKNDYKKDSFKLLNLYWILGFLVFVQLWIMWPGILAPDSQTQYAQAVGGRYSDHHPALMSFVWRYLDKIVSGPGPMFALQLALFYGALFFYMRSVASFGSRLFFLALPFIPQIFVFSSMILKDVGFAFSFLWCSACLSYRASTYKKLLWYEAIFVAIVLFYGTALKFQAQYCAPILLAWMASMITQAGVRSRKWIGCFVGLLLVFYGCLYGTNRLLVPETQKSHSWQYVKLYDLAGIAAQTKESNFPAFSKLPTFSMPIFLARFDAHPSRVDELAFGSDALLRIGRDPAEREALYKAWLEALGAHPVLYLRHRLRNLSYTLCALPGFTMGPRLIEKIAAPNTATYKILYGIGSVFSQAASDAPEIPAITGSAFYDRVFCKVLTLAALLSMSHLIPAILCVVYFLLGLRAVGKTWEAAPLVAMNAVGLMMIGVLFFCSMAGTLRYTYVMVCMVHASHLFAYRCYQALRK